MSCLTLIILYKLGSFGCHGGVSVHNVVIHKSRSTEQRETSRGTKYTTKHVLSSLLQPMATSVLEHLEPDDWTCKYENKLLGEFVSEFCSESSWLNSKHTINTLIFAEFLSLILTYLCLWGEFFHMLLPLSYSSSFCP